MPDSIYLNFLFLKSRAIIVRTLYISMSKLSLISAEADIISFWCNTIQSTSLGNKSIRAYRAQTKEWPEGQIISLCRTYCTRVIKMENSSRNYSEVKFNFSIAQYVTKETTLHGELLPLEGCWWTPLTCLMSAHKERLTLHINSAGIFRFSFIGFPVTTGKQSPWTVTALTKSPRRI